MGLGASVTPLGVGFLLVLTVTGWSAVSLLLTPLLLLSLVFPPAKPIYRRVTHFAQWAWMGNVVFLLEYAYGIRVSFTGDAATKANESKLMSGERALWLSNHRTRIDWMLLWSLAVRTGTLGQMKIVLKAPLRQIPIFGWAMQHFLFIFLNRRWSDDEKMLQEYLPFLTSKEPHASYLLFPEGTDMSDANIAKNAAFATKNDLPQRKYSLYPRTTGFNFMFPRLRAQLDVVYDVTMFYVDHTPNERPSEAALLSGRTPRSIHFHIERLAIQDFASSAQELTAWVEHSFARKEANLAQFYESGNGALPDGAQPLALTDPTASFAVMLVFWLWFGMVAMQVAWVCGWWSVVLGGAIAVAYAVTTAALGGVDGILRKTL